MLRKILISFTAATLLASSYSVSANDSDADATTQDVTTAEAVDLTTWQNIHGKITAFLNGWQNNCIGCHLD